MKTGFATRGIWLPAFVVIALIGALFYVLYADLNRPPPSGGNAESEHQANSTNEHQQGQAGQQPTEVAPLAQQPKRQHRIAAKSEEEGGWYANPDWWVAGFTGALFIVTAGLWFVTGLLWRATNRAVTEGQEAIKAAQASAKAADAGAKAAERAVEVGRQTLLATDRPWISIEHKPVEPLKFGPEEITVSVDVAIKNIGRSPATNVTVVARLCLDIADASNEGFKWLDVTRRAGISMLSFGTILFPDVTDRRVHNLSIKREGFIKRIAEMAADSADPADRYEDARPAP